MEMNANEYTCHSCGTHLIFQDHYNGPIPEYLRCPTCGNIFKARLIYYEIKEKNKAMNPKTKVERHKELCEYLNDLYARKNADYGDSFHITYEQEGMAMPRIRLGDKFNRFCTLSRGNNQQVKDESLRDTLLDLANYALMTVLEMDAEGGQT